MRVSRPARRSFLSPWISWSIRLFLFSLLLWILLIPIYKFADPPLTWLMIKRCWLENPSLKWQHRNQNLRAYSAWIPMAVIAAEDQKFLQHNGFDLHAIRQALKHNKRHPRRPRGASTLSQQTAKNVFLWPDRSWIRKILEIPFTAAIEILWGKRRILEVYLNVCELGPGIFGFEAAARYWFHKPAAQLSRRETALLAATLPAPQTFNPRAPSPALSARADWIEEQMQFLNKAEMQRELCLPNGRP